MLTMLERKEAATGRKDKTRSSSSLVEQKDVLEKATRKTVGLGTRAFSKTLRDELAKLKAS
ncbi:hypothetical protein [Brucella pituitosa]|uniref:hypothetical protein n=1 Tax=Brucella pituitosa TaxID=571256 RepID=UPI0012FE21DA|nr:hypothetical protein [Brucella pituitosa]